MTRAFMSWRYLMLVCVALLMTTTTVRAQGKGKGKDKDNDPKPNVVQIDLNQLPPDLAKQIQAQMKGNPGGKPAMAPAPKAVGRLESVQNPLPAHVGNFYPPGLAKKASNHPGRMAYDAMIQRRGAQGIPQQPMK